MIHKTDFYYYDDQGGIYSNRIDAKLSGRYCWFHFHDDYFSKLDWLKTPVETLPQLYKQRAQQIRDSYDHVVICYSGGIDSTNVLESFYYNNIHIDEIFIMGPFSQDTGQDDQLHNGCAYHNAFPTLSRMSLPNTKISVVDHSQHLRNPHDFTAIAKYGNEYYKYIGSRPSIHHLLWHDLDKILGCKDRTAYVWGKEKPFIRYDSAVGRYYTHFGDISFVNYGNRYGYLNGDRINFYTAPECSDLMLKQLHLIRDWHSLNVLANRNLSDDQFNSDYSRIIKKIIYDLRNPLVFENSKTKSYYLAKRDEFILDHRDSEMFKIYIDSMKKLFNDIQGIDNFSFVSKRYYLS